MGIATAAGHASSHANFADITLTFLDISQAGYRPPDDRTNVRDGIADGGRERILTGAEKALQLDVIQTLLMFNTSGDSRKCT
ncbi:MAG: hypothetical protein KGY81_04740 [Phycisphaerae bacterium]|nr:hypothetical protein [Phycisphaerae bacterium]